MANDDLFEINTQEDAKDAWQIFFNRFYSAEVPKGISVKFDVEQREFIPRQDKKAKDKKFSDSTGRTDHSDDFDDFLNGHTVKIPNDFELNESNLIKLEHAISVGNYQDILFTNENHVFYALWLFKQNKISRQQLSTLLAREQFPKNFPIIRTFSILDGQGEFSEEAKQMLLPMLEKNRYNQFEDWHLQRFRLLMQAAPKSEQIFYIAECDPNSVAIRGEIQLGNALLKVKSWDRAIYKKRLYDLHLSFGAMEARQIALKGVHGAAANRAIIGEISPGKIKEGMLNYFRPTAISINNSGVQPTVENIHNYPASTMPAVTMHDIYHSRLHNTIPQQFHMALNHMKDIMFNFTKVKFSHEQWILTDREFIALKGKKIDLNPKKGAKYFEEMLLKSELSPTHLLFNDENFFNLSDDGIAIIRDMVINSEKWKKLYKIDIYFLGSPYDRVLQQMRSFIKLTQKEAFDPKLFSLKYRIFCDLPKRYRKINELINSISDTLMKELKFKKESYKEIKDRVMLKWDETLISNGKIAFRAVLVSYFDSKFGMDKEQKLDCEFIQLEEEFKSIYQGSQFDKKLDASCHKLESLFDQLNLLELCYQKIIITSYARRNPNIDNYLSSFFVFKKNPLTQSQRKHIGLLKAKMRNLINEYLVSITDTQEKEQFVWAVNNYFKLAHYKDWSFRVTSMTDKPSHASSICSNFTKV